jgi:DNA (cytosine-5)-methyltransferase 1
MNTSPPTVVDLFCGAGGLSLGFLRAGFQLIHAIDHWLPAVKTYRLNIGGHIIQREILENIEIPRVTVITGGPPCQGFSSAGRRQGDDQRNSLVSIFAQIVARMKPEAFVFENVEGFFTTANGRYVLDLLEPLLDAGYRIHLRKINAANYGIPQHRKRVLAIGGLGWNPTFPEPTHTAHGAPGSRTVIRTLPLAPSILDALGGLPSPSNDAQAFPADHDSRQLEGLDLERALLLKAGQSMRDLPEALWHESYRRRAFRRVKDGTPTERRGGAPAGLRRLHPDEPSKAITGGALRDFLHPFDNRYLTIRECARLQTFSDDFCFYGSRAEKIQLIGNAVPPQLAEQIACHVLADLQNPGKKCSTGELLSFLPTHSNGLSPVLETVVQRVKNCFSLTNKKSLQRSLWD